MIDQSVRTGDLAAVQAIDSALWLDTTRSVDPAVPAPVDVLGGDLGDGASTGGEILRYCAAVAAATPRVVLLDYGLTHQSRGLQVAIVGQPSQLADVARSSQSATLRTFTTNARAGLSSARPSGDPRSPLLPKGALMRITLDPHHPLSAGVDREQTVIAAPDATFDASPTARVIGRCAGPDEIVAGRLVWPQAADLMAHHPWAWTETIGRGTVITFSTDPVWRCIPAPIAAVFSCALLLP